MYPNQVETVKELFKGEIVSKTQQEKSNTVIKNFFGDIIVDDKAVEALEKQQAENIAKCKQVTEEEKIRKLKNCGIGSAYFNVNYNSYVRGSKEQIDNFKTVQSFIADIQQSNFRTLWICGNNGTGKTMLGALICKECLGTYRRMYDIEDELEDTKRYGSTETRADMFKRYSNYPVLVLDEVGRNPNEKTGEELKALFHIINDRYENRKPTILISNLSKADMGKYLGRAIVDRFSQNCKSVEFTGESYRKELNQYRGA